MIGFFMTHISLVVVDDGNCFYSASRSSTHGLYRVFLFFSSRRRHTRWPRDWSSDVCSSDLDILDVASEASGKTPGTDLREGVPTLPTLYAMRSTDDASRRLRQLLSKPIDDDAELDEALSLLRAHPAMDEARDYVRARADTARGMLDSLPDVPARDVLIDLCKIGRAHV